MADALKTGRAISDYPSTDGQYSGREQQQQGLIGGVGGPEEEGAGEQYPDTDAQFERGSSGSAVGTTAPEELLQQGANAQYTPEEYAVYCEQYYAWYGVDPPEGSAGMAASPAGAAAAAGDSDAVGQPEQKKQRREGGGDDGAAALALIACYGSDSDED